MKTNKIIINRAINKELYVTVKGKNNKTIATTETYKEVKLVKCENENEKGGSPYYSYIYDFLHT